MILLAALTSLLGSGEPKAGGTAQSLDASNAGRVEGGEVWRPVLLSLHRERSSC